MIMGKFFPVDDPDSKQRILCEHDYLTRLNLVCSKCNDGLYGGYIVSGDKKYHPKYFTCSLCSTLLALQDSYYEHNGSMFCHWHYSTCLITRCAGCNTAILKEFVEGKGETIHPECYPIYKFWDIKIAAKSTQLPYAVHEIRTAPELLKVGQMQKAARVHSIYTTLNTFGGSTAMIIRSIFSSKDH